VTAGLCWVQRYHIDLQMEFFFCFVYQEDIVATTQEYFQSIRLSVVLAGEARASGIFITPWHRCGSS